ncbi:NPC intracellular cholesterol transporter 1 [Sarracenia purpurea var. burkii]
MISMAVSDTINIKENAKGKGKAEMDVVDIASEVVKGNLTVNGIQYYITDTFGERLYESCKDVKFGTMNTRAMEFIGAGAKNFKGTLSYANTYKFTCTGTQLQKRGRANEYNDQA